MAADAAYAIGNGHVVCQDYAAAVRNAAMVSDGCSGSPDTDIGSRMLVLAAIVESVGGLDETLAIRSAGLALKWASAIGIPTPSTGPGCLDATLLHVYKDDGWLRATVCGDGGIVARRTTGELEWHGVEYAAAAPPYPIYGLQQHRLEAWKSVGVGSVRTWNGQWESPTPTRFFSPISMAFSVDSYDLVGVVSDGVTTFVDGVKPVDEVEVLRHLVAFRSFAGGFVQRRLRRFLRKTCVEMGWCHHDDISIAVVTR